MAIFYEPVEVVNSSPHIAQLVRVLAEYQVAGPGRR